MGRRLSRREFLQYSTLTGAGLLAALYAGCAPEATPSDAPGASSAPDGLPKLTSATLRSAIGSDVGSLDPHSLAEEIPNPASPPSGCRFRTRCPLAIEECAHQAPEWRGVAPGHRVACLRV